MAWFEPLIVVGAISFVGLVIFLSFFFKKKGKSLGGCCQHKCSSCAKCHSNCDKIHKEYRKMYSK